MEATWFASKDRGMLVRHDWSRGWRQAGGAVGIKQSVGDRPDLAAPRARATLAGAHLPPRPHAPSLNLPFPNPRSSLIYTTGPAPTPGFPHRHLVVGVVALLRSLFPVDFCEVPPLLSAFAHVPFYPSSFRRRLSTHSTSHSLQLPVDSRIAFGRLSSHLLLGQQLHSYYPRTYIHTSRLDRVFRVSSPHS